MRKEERFCDLFLVEAVEAVVEVHVRAHGQLLVEDGSVGLAVQRSLVLGFDLTPAPFPDHPDLAVEPDSELDLLHDHVELELVGFEVPG